MSDMEQVYQYWGLNRMFLSLGRLFFCLLIAHSLGSWLHKLMSLSGYLLSLSFMFLVILNFSAITGTAERRLSWRQPGLSR